MYECLQKEWFANPQKKLDSLVSKTPERFKLCISENGKSIEQKLYKLKKKESLNLKELKKMWLHLILKSRIKI